MPINNTVAISANQVVSSQPVDFLDQCLAPITSDETYYPGKVAEEPFPCLNELKDDPAQLSAALAKVAQVYDELTQPTGKTFDSNDYQLLNNFMMQLILDHARELRFESDFASNSDNALDAQKPEVGFRILEKLVNLQYSKAAIIKLCQFYSQVPSYVATPVVVVYAKETTPNGNEGVIKKGGQRNTIVRLVDSSGAERVLFAAQQNPLAITQPNSDTIAATSNLIGLSELTDNGFLAKKLYFSNPDYLLLHRAGVCIEKIEVLSGQLPLKKGAITVLEQIAREQNLKLIKQISEKKAIDVDAYNTFYDYIETDLANLKTPPMQILNPPSPRGLENSERVAGLYGSDRSSRRNSSDNFDFSDEEEGLSNEQKEVLRATHRLAYINELAKLSIDNPLRIAAVRQPEFYINVKALLSYLEARNQLTAVSEAQAKQNKLQGIYQTAIKLVLDLADAQVADDFTQAKEIKEMIIATKEVIEAPTDKEKISQFFQKLKVFSQESVVPEVKPHPNKEKVAANYKDQLSKARERYQRNDQLESKRRDRRSLVSAFSLIGGAVVLSSGIAAAVFIPVIGYVALAASIATFAAFVAVTGYLARQAEKNHAAAAANFIEANRCSRLLQMTGIEKPSEEEAKAGRLVHPN